MTVSQGLNTPASKSSPRVQPYPDMDMAVECFISSREKICLFHDKVWSKPLCWLEYNADTLRLDFITDEGRIINFGMTVDPSMRFYFDTLHAASVIHRDPASGEVYAGAEVPLILQRG